MNGYADSRVQVETPLTRIRSHKLLPSDRRLRPKEVKSQILLSCRVCPSGSGPCRPPQVHLQARCFPFSLMRTRMRRITSRRSTPWLALTRASQIHLQRRFGYIRGVSTRRVQDDAYCTTRGQSTKHLYRNCSVQNHTMVLTYASH